MAIKKRPAVDPVAEAQIEAFGAAADAAPPVAPVTRAPSSARTKPAANAPELAKTFLIRYPDDTLPLLLDEVAEMEDRSKHAVAIRALQRGLEAMKADPRR